MEMEGFDGVIRDCLQENGNLRLGNKLRRLKQNIKIWKGKNVGESSQKIKELEIEIDKVEKEGEDNYFTEEQKEKIIGMKIQLGQLYALEEREWIQKSRIKWAKEGDRNTKYFHLKVKERMRTNKIIALTIGQKLTSQPAEIKRTITRHFENHFNKVKVVPVQRLELGFKKLSEENNRELERPFSMEEIKRAIDECEGSRAPGPDGFNLKFFKRYWEVVKDDLMKVMEEFFQTGKLAKGINSSFITLIPKSTSPEHIEEYRPKA